MLKITEKLRPFSHQPGTACLVPNSDWVVRAFPALLKIDSIDIPIRVTGPVRDFTVQMDLERDCVWIWGISEEGHFRLKLSADETGLLLFIDRAPKEGIEIGVHKYKAKDKILLMSGGSLCSPQQTERLSLGNWKAQDWDLVCRRSDESEWAPILFLLGQKIPASLEVKGGPVSLLDEPTKFFHAAFTGICVPHLKDPLHQGLFVEEGDGSALSLLPMAYRKIRSFLIQQDEKILPALPSHWDCGRLLGLKTRYGVLDLEWSKGLIRQMCLHAEQSGDVTFTFQKQIKSFRFNGQRVEKGQPLLIEAAKKYHFDRFQK